jgi:hypothetical protein
MKFLLLILALFVSLATAQLVPIPVPDPGPPVTTMRPGHIYIKNSSIPTPRLGVSVEQITETATDSDTSAFPGEWPGYAVGVVGPFTKGRNGGAQRVFCARSHYGYDDPIVYPGQKGKSHLHVFFGNTSTTGVSTPLTIRTRGNSTCAGGTANRSAYWAPAIIYVCDTLAKMNGVGVAGGRTCDWRRNGEVVQTLYGSDILVYYKAYFGDGEWTYGTLGAAGPSTSWSPNHDTEAFPVGFRMISGDSTRTTAGDSDIWECQYPSGLGSTFRNIPGTGMNNATTATQLDNCVAGGAVKVQQFVKFPTCGADTLDLDSPTHNTHIINKIQDPRPGALTGDFKCPDGYSHPYVGVEFKVVYPFIPADMPFWRLSSDRYSTDDPAGYSNHGDWFNGWDPDIMDEWVFNCDTRGTDCHVGVLGPVVPNESPTFDPDRRWRVLKHPRYDR